MDVSVSVKIQIFRAEPHAGGDPLPDPSEYALADFGTTKDREPLTNV